MKTITLEEPRQLDEAEVAAAEARQIAGAPARGAGSDLRRTPRGRTEAQALHMFQQLDTHEGRMEAKQDAILDGIKRMANFLGAAQGRGRGRPLDDRYQLIADYHTAAVEAVGELAADNELLRLGLLDALDRTKRKVEQSLALRTHSGDGSDPTKPLRERNRRARKRAPKASAT